MMYLFVFGLLATAIAIIAMRAAIACLAGIIIAVSTKIKGHKKTGETEEATP